MGFPQPIAGEFIVLLGYDQSGHIPTANPNDPEVILWSGKQQSNTGCKGTLGSVPGFGPRTFGLSKFIRLNGKVSHSESAPGFEPGTSRKSKNSLCGVARGASRAGVFSYGMG